MKLDKKVREIEYSPNPELMALRPDVSGNDINGRGETEFRRPTPVYWQEPETIAHGDMQNWFGQGPLISEVTDALQRREEILNTPLPDKATIAVEKSAATWAGELRPAALSRDADLVGIARFDNAWSYDRCEDQTLPWVIVLGVEQDYEAMLNVPDQLAGAEVLNQYGRALKAARTLAGWILEQGYEAIPFGSPSRAKFTMIPPALESGFGELGKHGSIINRKFGANFRLSAVLTDMPLVAQSEDVFGADDFCLNCRVCEKACPVDAIATDKQFVRGVKRWYIDFDRCIPFFNEHLGCSICTTICPWSRPGIAQNLAEKYARRT
jgi:Pyruvate/2-oxoacid:ferredoxin oxidoreductase delta subunit